MYQMSVLMSAKDCVLTKEWCAMLTYRLYFIFYFRGASPGTNTEEFVARVERLKDEVRRLDQIEKDVDKHRGVSILV